MGKQKRTKSHHTKPSLPPSPDSESMPCSSKVVSGSNEKALVLVDAEQEPLPSVMDVTDSSLKMPYSHPSLSPHNYNISRSVFLKRSRHYYGHQYFRRKSVNCAGPSTSLGIATPSREERLTFKLANQCNSHNGSSADNWEKAVANSEVIRPCSSSKDTVSSDMVNMVCWICEKLLRRKPYGFGSALSSSEFAVVAVLVCGHVYHAECLENRTCHEQKTDPLCPMCISIRTPGDSSKGKE